jgi:hypothetical protein
MTGRTSSSVSRRSRSDGNNPAGTTSLYMWDRCSDAAHTMGGMQQCYQQIKCSLDQPRVPSCYYVSMLTLTNEIVYANRVIYC